jgi:transcriptional antiterminator RfaH
MTSRWYVVQTQPHAETKAMGHLIRQDFGVYLPRYLKRRRHARRVETVAAPLFPRYLFVTVDMETQRWRSIHSTTGVARLVCNGDDPAPVSPDVVAALQRREDDGGFVKLERHQQFAPGERVRVVDGVFADNLGLFEGMADRERVAILLDLLGRKVRILLDEGAITAA